MSPRAVQLAPLVTIARGGDGALAHAQQLWEPVGAAVDGAATPVAREVGDAPPEPGDLVPLIDGRQVWTRQPAVMRDVGAFVAHHGHLADSAAGAIGDALAAVGRLRISGVRGRVEAASLADVRAAAEAISLAQRAARDGARNSAWYTGAAEGLVTGVRMVHVVDARGQSHKSDVHDRWGAVLAAYDRHRDAHVGLDEAVGLIGRLGEADVAGARSIVRKVNRELRSAASEVRAVRSSLVQLASGIRSHEIAHDALAIAARARAEADASAVPIIAAADAQTRDAAITDGVRRILGNGGDS